MRYVGLDDLSEEGHLSQGLKVTKKIAGRVQKSMEAQSMRELGLKGS